jgi:5-methylcytosine-specific restriction endonuclease McrA
MFPRFWEQSKPPLPWFCALSRITELRNRLRPFLYPKNRVVREHAPAGPLAYQRCKPHLRLDFERKCVYCRTPDGIQIQTSFEVDHYRPQSKFPELRNEYSNLYYACNSCNRRKGSFWPSADHLREGRFIANPCDHTMAQHLRSNATHVDHASKAGEFMIDLLDLNAPERIAHRALINSLIETVSAQINRLRTQHSRLADLLRSSSGRPPPKLVSDILLVEQAISTQHSTLLAVAGLSSYP